MRRATITIPDDLDAELSAYLAAQEPSPSLTALVQAALRRFLAEKRLERRLTERRLRPASSALSITPAPRGSGKSDVSIDHDRYLAKNA